MVACLLITAPRVRSLRAETVPESSVSPTVLGHRARRLNKNQGIMKERQGEWSLEMQMSSLRGAEFLGLLTLGLQSGR